MGKGRLGLMGRAGHDEAVLEYSGSGISVRVRVGTEGGETNQVPPG